MKSPSSANGGYTPAVDGLRAFAVLAVILYHCKPELLPGGFYGVDVFFVISGFLIGRIIFNDLKNGTFSFLTFYDRRIRRIVPAMAATLAATTVVAWFVLLPNQWAAFGKELLFASTGLANIGYALSTNYFAPAGEFLPLLHFWSLAVEEQFYFVIPLVLWALWKFRRPWITPALGLAFLLSILLWFSLRLFTEQPTLAFYTLPTRAWSLLAGVNLAWVVHCYPQTMRKTPAVLGGMGFLLIACAYAIPLPQQAAWVQQSGVLWVFPVLGATLLIAAMQGYPTSRQIPLALRWLAHPVFVGIGLMSYSLYLWHWPMLVLLKHTFSTSEFSTLLWSTYATALCVVSYLSWRFIEVPFRKGDSGWPTLRSRYGITFLISLGFAGIGLLVYKHYLPPFTNPSMPYAAILKPMAGASPLRESCHYTFNTPFLWGKSCILPTLLTSPSLIVWGDSHGTELAYGLAEYGLKPLGLSLRQLTATGCPPLLGIDFANRPQCKAYNKTVLRHLLQEPPTTIILAMNYQNYFKNIPAHTLWQGLTQTLQALRQHGHHVVLLGPFPSWSYPVPEAVGRLAANGQAPSLLVTPAPKPLDTSLIHNFSTEATLFLPSKILCQGNVCAATNTQGYARSFDTNHPSLRAISELIPTLMLLILSPSHVK